MKTDDRDLILCKLMKKYVSNILRYTENLKRDELLKDSAIYDACVLNFINLGESVKSLSDDFKCANQEIPYNSILGLRNIAAHNYEGIEPFRIFLVIQNDLPVLSDQLSKIIEDAE
ncbi:MAG: HepT-like ribonuclease domain-containing protein [Leeuwenhoekiella sp.]